MPHVAQVQGPRYVAAHRIGQRMVTLASDGLRAVSQAAFAALVLLGHWIDPSIRYKRAWQLLRPGGHLAFWSATHVLPEQGDPFFVEIQEVYEEIGEGLPDGAIWMRPGELADSRDEIEGSGLFEDVLVREFDWEVVYDADSYLRLLDNTFPNHIAMQPWHRERVYSEIRRRLAQRPDGRLRRHWGPVLHVARRADRQAIS
ncbi:MAG: hypothetical protein WCD11_31550 [Solirubrobacteraceae bacterium]